MSIPGTLIPLFNSGAASTYQISRSLRFNSSDSAYLSRTPSTAGNRKTWTWAGWVKRSGLQSGTSNTYMQLFAAGTGAYARDVFFFDTDVDDVLAFYSTTGPVIYRTTAVFRDTSAWYHIVFAFDSTQSAVADRIKVYVNNVLQLNNGGSVTQNYDSFVNAANAHYIATHPPLTEYLSGYLADIHFIDGAALTPSSFTETDATTGQLVPKTYTGEYGTNGFKLTFSDNSNNTAATLGADTSGRGNNWTPFNLQTTTGDPTSVAAASGALPIYNTTDTYGTTKGTGTRTDTNSASIVLAVAMDGANGGTTFTDESATIKGSGSAKTISRNNVTTSTAQSTFYGSSGYFSSQYSYLSVGSSADFNFGAGDFTIECWVYLNSQGYGSASGYNHYFSIQYQDTFAFKSWSNYFYLYANSAVRVQTSSSPILNKWTHLALVRNGSVLTIYVNGVASGSASTSTTFGANATATVGTATEVSNENLDGYMQDLRVYKGVAKYTSNFNPPRSTQNATVAAGNDSLVDTPTNYGTDTGVGGEVRGNYCTLNPLGTAGAIPTNGNLAVSSSSTVGNRISTILLTTGKWYWEASGYGYVGAIIGVDGGAYTGSISGNGSKSIGYWWEGQAYWDGGNTPSGTSYNNTDIIGVVLDMNIGNVKFYKNNTLIHNLTFGSGSVPNLSTGVYAGYNVGAGVVSVDFNFGQRPFAYTAPSGFKAICTQNLPEGSITTSGTFTGNSSADGPFVYLNGVPTAMTINGNAVTFGTHADKLSNGFKVRNSTSSYNTSGSNTYSISSTGAKFKVARAQANP